MSTPSFALLSCDVFSEELTELGGPTPPWRSLVYLEMGLHDHPPRLRAEVQKSISQLEMDPGLETILLAYGRCGNGLIGVRAQRCSLVLPQAHDCISILLGGRKVHNELLAKNPATYFFSPGWMRGKRVPGPDRETHLRELYAERYADDEDMIEELIEADREAFAHHNCAAYVSIIDRPRDAAYCERCARHLNWQHQNVPGDPRILNDLLAGRWNPEDFLIVPPGMTIEADSDGNLIAVK